MSLELPASVGRDPLVLGPFPFEALGAAAETETRTPEGQTRDQFSWAENTADRGSAPAGAQIF